MSWKRRMGRLADHEASTCGEPLIVPDGRGGTRTKRCGQPAPYRCEARLNEGKPYTAHRCLQHAPALAARHGLPFPPGLWNDA